VAKAASKRKRGEAANGWRLSKCSFDISITESNEENFISVIGENKTKKNANDDKKTISKLAAKYRRRKSWHQLGETSSAMA
jgi:uncharacterized protein YifE (UPF0438 family)